MNLHQIFLKLEHSSVETIQMIQKVAAMGNWWLAASSRQHALSVPHVSCRGFWWNIKSPRWLTPLQPRFGTLPLLALPKLKSSLKGKRFQTVYDIQENTTRQLMVRLGELCEVPRCLLGRGLRRHCPMYNVSCFFFNKCLYFSYYIAGCFLNRPCIYLYTHIYLYIYVHIWLMWTKLLWTSLHNSLCGLYKNKNLI